MSVVVRTFLVVYYFLLLAVAHYANYFVCHMIPFISRTDTLCVCAFIIMRFFFSVNKLIFLSLLLPLPPLSLSLFLLPSFLPLPFHPSHFLPLLSPFTLGPSPLPSPSLSLDPILE